MNTHAHTVSQRGGQLPSAGSMSRRGSRSTFRVFWFDGSQIEGEKHPVRVSDGRQLDDDNNKLAALR